ncbi:hypothetical protein OE987_001480 [Vibrio cholerae]|nr:hypothetical protein [Vibrio cholerae]
MSDNDYYKRTKEFDPRTRANGLDVEFELDAISAAFDKIPAPRDDGQGYDGPIHVGEATAPTHAVQLQQMEAQLGDNTANANRAEEAAERAEEARDIAIEKARQSGEARDEALEAAATVTNIHREQLEKALGVNARVYPRLTNQNLKVGDVIPAPEDTADGLPITHVIVGGNAYAMSPLATGSVTAIGAGSATIGGVSVNLIQQYFAYTVDEVNALLAQGIMLINAYVKKIEQPVSLPANATVIFNGLTSIAMSGSVFTIVTGSRVYGDFIISAGFSPTVGHVDGAHRPSMLLSDNRRAGIYGTIRGEGALPHGRALFLDANARDEKQGIISWFECDLSLRNINDGCELQATNPTGMGSGKSYINNNYLKIAMWDVVNGYIENDVDTSKAEISSNNIQLDYQSSSVSVRIVRVRGTRNNICGNVWDTDRAAYPSLLTSAIDIGGSSNIVGGANWPSPQSDVVVITDALCKYTGYTYGIAKTLVKPLQVYSRIGFDNGNGAEGALVSQLGSLDNFIDVPAGSNLVTVYDRTYGFNINRANYYIDGYLLLKNTKTTPVNVQVRFGMLANSGALSSTFQVPAERVKKIDLSMMISRYRQNAICEDGSWYGATDYSNLTSHRVFIQITTAEGITVDGVHLKRVSNL